MITKQNSFRWIILYLTLAFFLSACGSFSKSADSLKNAKREITKKIDAKGNLIPDDLGKISDNDDNAAISKGQVWLFYTLAALFVAGIVISLIIKSPSAAVGCGVGALVMCLLPTFIEAINAALKGLIVAFYILLGSGVIGLVVFVVYRVFNFIPKKHRAITLRPHESSQSELEIQ